MKKLIIPKIAIDATNIDLVAEHLNTLPINLIDKVNWSEKYPSKPSVSFRIAHNGDNILLQYDVKEREVLAAVAEDNGKVWTDTCVEFFVSFDDAHYYNGEFTCIGKALLGYREYYHKAEHAPNNIMRSIKRLSTLGETNIEKKQGDFDWKLTLVIPITAYWHSGLKTLDGVKAKGNFFKCGDNLTEPHYVSWTQIDTPSPSFHQPRFFGELEFEA